MICCVTGHRPKGFPFRCRKTSRLYRNYLYILRKRIGELIEKGYRTFMTGMAQGADMDFAEAVLRFKQKLRKKHIDIILMAVIPCPNQTKGWTVEQVRRYQRILRKCDFQKEISSCYHWRCMQDRNEYMVDRADLVVAIWNGEKGGGTWNTIQYAQAKEKEISYIFV